MTTITLYLILFEKYSFVEMLMPTLKLAYTCLSLQLFYRN